MRSRPTLSRPVFYYAAVFFVVAGCATGAAVSMPAAGQVEATEVRIEDARGPLGPKRTAAAVARIEGENGEGLLRHHLAHVDGVLSRPLVLGNDARLLIDGPMTKGAMFEAISKAQRNIDLETYILEPIDVGERLIEAMLAKHADGVRVRILYDSVGSMATPAAFFENLAALGVEVCEFNPVNPLKAEGDSRLSINNRDHRKVLVVDADVAFTGGINISAVYSAGSFGRKRMTPSPDIGWRDTHVQVRGPVVAQFQTLFDETWQSQRCSSRGDGEQVQGLVRSKPEAGQVKSAGGQAAGRMAARLVAADPQTEQSELYLALLSAIEHSRQRVWLTYGYFVPDEGMLDALRSAAARGVDVRLVLPGFSDFWAPFHAGRSHYAGLLEAGVHILERRDALLHAKTAVIDGVWSSVGSTNLDWRSFVHNYEADLLVVDQGFARELEKLFELDQSASHEVTQAEWKRRGVINRVLEWVARRWEYLL